jgi:Tfp pilus assembly protein FimV
MSELPDTVKEALYEAAKGPKRASNPHTTAESHDLDALMRVADREAVEEAVEQNHWGLRFRKIKPPGGG